jgi:Fuc2NAc and GlcNAc transferase
MQLFILFLSVLLISWISTLFWLYIARKLLWLDRPNQRSSHEMPVPTSGGIGFIIAFSILTFVLFSWQIIALKELLLFSSGIFLAITGFIDDLKSLSIGKRLLVQFAVSLCVAFLVEGAPVFDILGVWQISGIASKTLLVFGLVWLVNLYNFMDGIDALAVTEAIFYSLAIPLLALSGGGVQVSIIALGLGITLCAFLYFNLPPAKIFMGDMGSNYLGLVLGALGILAISSGSVTIWTLLVLLGVFIVDSTSTLMARILGGAVWYHGHKSHAYQRAARKFRSHGKVVAVVCAINVIWLLPIAWMTTRYPEMSLFLTAFAWLPLALLCLYCKKWSNDSSLS